MSDEIAFPQYPAPPTTGVPVAERRDSAPLWKVMKLHLKPMKRLEKTPFLKKTHHKVKKKVRYY